MAKVFHLRAPETVSLHKMDEKAIQKLVETEVGKVLEQIVKQARPVGVNMVTVSQMPRGADGWAEWTRACCGSRELIDQYVDPSPEDMEHAGRLYRPSVDHIESTFTVQTNANPAMHGAAGGAKVDSKG